MTIPLTSIIISSYLDRRNLIARDSVPYRQPSLNEYPQYWCAPGCETYISVTYISNIPGQTWSVVQNMLSGAKAQTLSHVRAVGDGVVGGSGLFSYRASGLEVFTSNSNNHQQTWGVLSAALVALADYFTEIQENISGLPGSVTFVVYDGENEVATGGFGTA